MSNPSSTVLNRYTSINCTTSTETCCDIIGYFVNESWYDSTLGEEYSIQVNCYQRKTSKTVWLRIQSDGVPNHPYSSASSYIGPQDYDYMIQLSQTRTTQSAQDTCNSSILGFDVVGFAINGVPITSPLSVDAVDALNPPSGFDAESFDNCYAHPNAKYMYHYHLASPCMTGYSPKHSIGNTACYGSCSSLYTSQYYNGSGNYASTSCNSSCIEGTGFSSGSSSTVIGIALDGNLFYGPYDENGDDITGLDNCNGKYVDGDYRYYATDTFPYLIGCYGPGKYNVELPTCTSNSPDAYSYGTDAPSVSPTVYPPSSPTPKPTANAPSVSTSINSDNIPPNIIYVLIDDLGWNDVGFRSTDLTFATPNIDKLVSEGILLTSYYVQPMCTPTRATFFTGKTTSRLGLQSISFGPRSADSLSLNESLLSQELQAAGYHTTMVGKWHLGHHDWAATPIYRGFDSFYGYWSSGSLDYYTKKVDVQSVNYLDFWKNITVANSSDDFNVFTTYLYQEMVEEILVNHTNWYGSGQNRTKPLFLFYAMQNVHAPLEAPSEIINNAEKCGSIVNGDRKIYCAMVYLADQAIGNLTKALKDLGMEGDTLLLVSSDNGGNPLVGGNNYPLRGSKASFFEGGVRAPAVLWGGYLPSNTSGTIYDGLIHIADWYPTFLHLADRVVSAACNEDFDGYNVYNSIIHNQTSPRSEILFMYDDVEEKYVLRVGDLKLITRASNGSLDQVISVPSTKKTPSYSSGKWSNFTYLFNITADPYEQNNLYNTYPDLVSYMFAKLEGYESDVSTPLVIRMGSGATEVAQETHTLAPWEDSGVSPSSTCWVKETPAPIPSPTSSPTPSPTSAPTISKAPTVSPTNAPTFSPTGSKAPTVVPTNTPTFPSSPSSTPSSAPKTIPSSLSMIVIGVTSLFSIIFNIF